MFLWYVSVSANVPVWMFLCYLFDAWYVCLSIPQLTWSVSRINFCCSYLCLCLCLNRSKLEVATYVLESRILFLYFCFCLDVSCFCLDEPCLLRQSTDPIRHLPINVSCFSFCFCVCFSSEFLILIMFLFGRFFFPCYVWSVCLSIRQLTLPVSSINFLLFRSNPWSDLGNKEPQSCNLCLGFGFCFCSVFVSVFASVSVSLICFSHIFLFLVMFPFGYFFFICLIIDLCVFSIRQLTWLCFCLEVSRFLLICLI